MAEQQTRMGNGTHVYEVVQGWAKFPSHVKVGYTHGIVVDGQDNVYVFHTGTPSIVKFDRDGNFLSACGEEFAEGAHGFYLHKEGNEEFFYITDVNKGFAAKIKLDGTRVLTFNTPEQGGMYDAERRFVPTDIAVGPNGDIYISDGYGQSWVHQYDKDGGYIRSWGGKGTEPGKMSCPHGISVDMRSGEPEIYVADRGNHRIQVFTPDGQFKRMFDDDMDMPDNFYFFGDEMYFPDLHSRVTIFDRNDRLITHLGEDQKAYKQEGWPNLPKTFYRTNKFSSPHGVCVDSNRDVYVAEWISDGRITKLARI